MTAISTKAMEMKMVLARLQRKHDVEADVLVLPLAPSSNGPQVLEGFATTTDIDLQRTSFRAYAFGYPLLFRHGLPKLHAKHDESKTVGTIDSLTYDSRGQLKIRATVDDPHARRLGAFSVGARVRDYELRDADTDGFHAVVTSAEVVEVSLTDLPANPHALVQRRYPASPVVHEQLPLIIKRVDRLRQLARLIQQEVRP